MDRRSRLMCSVLVIAVLAQAPSQGTVQPAPKAPPPVAVRTAVVDGLTLQYLKAGHGPAVVLLHGYAETSRMWRPLMPRLAAERTVIAPDLPGIGGSDVPDGRPGHGKRGQAHPRSDPATRCGACRGRGPRYRTDGGLRVCRTISGGGGPARLHGRVSPRRQGVGGHLQPPRDLALPVQRATPEALVKDRERTYFEHFWNDFAADGTRSIPEADRQAYAPTTRGRGGCERPGPTSYPFSRRRWISRSSPNEPDDARDDHRRGQGEWCGAGEAGNLVATNSSSLVLPNTGHWIMEESRKRPWTRLCAFWMCTRVQPSDPRPYRE